MSLARFERTLLESDSADAPLPATKAAARRAMLEAAGIGTAVAATAAKASTAKTASALGTAKIVKLVLVSALAISGASVAIVAATRTRGLDRPAASTAIQPTAPLERLAAPKAAATEERASDLPTITPADLPSASIAARPSAAPKDALDPLAAEAAILARAKRALESGDASGAAAALHEHDTRFPNGPLAIEAEVLGVDLALAKGERDAARAKARALLAKNPDGPWAKRLATVARDDAP